jgi:hypothetical protein
MTFKQKVEEIVCPDIHRQSSCEQCQKHYSIKCDKVFTIDRILAAYKEAVEGMPEVEVEPHSYNNPEDVSIGVSMQREACKSYMLEELK